MGTRNFYTPALGIGMGGFHPGNLNLEARAGSIGHYSGMEAANAANRDIAAAQALYKSHVFKNSKKSSASNAKGPKV